MKQLFYLVITGLIFLSSCKEETKKFTDGTEYRIISNDKGQQIVNGNFIEVEILKKHKDSVLYDSRDIMPNFGLYDTTQFPPLFKVIFKNIRVGDSVYTRNLVDSIYKGNLPPYAKKGEYETTTYKFKNVYTTKEQTDSAYQKWLPIAKARSAKKMNEQIQKELKANEAQIKADDKIITDYIATRQLVATKAPWGTYVVITTPGSGDNLTDTSIAVVKYTGKTLADTVFDSNIDPKFGHTDPISVDLGQVGSVILGWTDALKQMKKGSKGKFLIPSSLGYGKAGSGNIKPNEILIFDIEVVDVITTAQYQAQQMEMQRKQMEMQQRMQEQMQRQQQQQPPQQQK